MLLEIDDALLKPGEHLVISLRNSTESENLEVFRYTMPFDGLSERRFHIKKIFLGAKEG